jgi:hypothetical protein
MTSSAPIFLILKNNFRQRIYRCSVNLNSAPILFLVVSILVTTRFFVAKTVEQSRIISRYIFLFILFEILDFDNAAPSLRANRTVISNLIYFKFVWLLSFKESKTLSDLK